jgi:hypothetical protein
METLTTNLRNYIIEMNGHTSLIGYVLKRLIKSKTDQKEWMGLITNSMETYLYELEDEISKGGKPNISVEFSILRIIQNVTNNPFVESTRPFYNLTNDEFEIIKQIFRKLTLDQLSGCYQHFEGIQRYVLNLNSDTFKCFPLPRNKILEMLNILRDPSLNFSSRVASDFGDENSPITISIAQGQMTDLQSYAEIQCLDSIRELIITEPVKNDSAVNSTLNDEIDYIDMLHAMWQDMIDSSRTIQANVREQLGILESAFGPTVKQLKDEVLGWIEGQQDPLMKCANETKTVLVDEADTMVKNIYSMAFGSIGLLANYGMGAITTAENIANTYLQLDGQDKNELTNMLIGLFKVDCWRIRKRVIFTFFLIIGQKDTVNPFIISDINK